MFKHILLTIVVLMATPSRAAVFKHVCGSARGGVAAVTTLPYLAESLSYLRQMMPEAQIYTVRDSATHQLKKIAIVNLGTKDFAKSSGAFDHADLVFQEMVGKASGGKGAVYQSFRDKNILNKRAKNILKLCFEGACFLLGSTVLTETGLLAYAIHDKLPPGLVLATGGAIALGGYIPVSILASISDSIQRTESNNYLRSKSDVREAPITEVISNLREELHQSRGPEEEQDGIDIGFYNFNATNEAISAEALQDSAGSVVESINYAQLDAMIKKSNP